MPATIASRYRLASPSATGMESGLFAVQTVLSLVLRAEQTASLCLRATTMRPRSSVTSVKFWNSADSLRASNGRPASLWTCKYGCSNKCYCLDGKDLPALCSEHLKMMLLKEPGQNDKFSEWLQHWQVGQEVQAQLKLRKIRSLAEKERRSLVSTQCEGLAKGRGFAQGHHQTGSGWFPSEASVGPLR